MYTFDDIITQNEQMIENIKKAKLLADADFPILIYGETGTGKELFANAIHQYGKRKNTPFIAQNCSNLPETIFESMLWGVEKGAYTGAIERPGLLEEANGGTIFLDEINSLPLHLQTKLLRVLENKKVLRVGASKSFEVDVRIITAMNDTPEQVLKKNLIRSDLFFRLTTGCLELSPLRKRVDDIKVYTDYFIDKNNKKYNKFIKGISPEVEKIFINYNWKGNVRELENIIENAFFLTEGDYIDANNIPEYIFTLKDKKSNMTDDDQSFNIYKEAREKGLVKVLENIEKMIILQSLNSHSYSIGKTAKELCIPRQTLKYKIDKLNLLQ